MQKELASVNAEQLRHDINHINMIILNFIQKGDFDKLAAEVAKLKLSLQDQDYALKNLLAKHNDLESKV